MALPKKTHEVDFCVVGGGMAGLAAAIAAARHGAKVALMHERPMLGGNASSEIRMWVCGAAGENNRETGLLEEIRMENFRRNPEKIWPIWDSILYEKAAFEPNLTLLLNCSCCDAEMDGDRIVSVTGWQMTTQTWHTVKAKYFADCSGDSVLAPLTGAEYRVGREAASEFGEKTSVTVADRKTMGMSCLLTARKGERPSAFIAPAWAKKLTREELAFRRPNLESPGENFWYLELGGNRDSIHDTETLRDELLALALGMWDAIKNSGEFDADLWQLDFLGFLPGKRESRRMVGDYMMTQGDVLSGGRFEDTVAFGGWPLDDHHPDGFYHAGHPNTWGATPAPYGIPYRVLYSKNIDNLYFAGRNVSMTHAALSSARVMATCLLMGQAVGAAAAIAAEHNESPRDVYRRHLDLLQQRLMYDDCFLPGFRRRIPQAALDAKLACDRDALGLVNLRNGADRNNWTYGPEEQGFSCPAGSTVTYTLAAPAAVSRVRLLFDSDLDRKSIPIEDRVERIHNTRSNVKPDSPVLRMPAPLLRDFTVEYEDENGQTVTLCDAKDNIYRLVSLPLGKTVRSVSLRLTRDWGEQPQLHLFSFDFD